MRTDNGEHYHIMAAASSCGTAFRMRETTPLEFSCMHYVPAAGVFYGDYKVLRYEPDGSVSVFLPPVDPVRDHCTTRLVLNRLLHFAVADHGSKTGVMFSVSHNGTTWLWRVRKSLGGPLRSRRTERGRWHQIVDGELAWIAVFAAEKHQASLQE